MTSYKRRCDVMTSHRRWYDAVLRLSTLWVKSYIAIILFRYFDQQLLYTSKMLQPIKWNGTIRNKWDIIDAQSKVTWIPVHIRKVPSLWLEKVNSPKMTASRTNIRCKYKYIFNFSICYKLICDICPLTCKIQVHNRDVFFFIFHNQILFMGIRRTISLKRLVWARKYDIRFPTMWYVRPANAQTSLRLRVVWSEPLLVAWICYDC